MYVGLSRASSVSGADASLCAHQRRSVTFISDMRSGLVAERQRAAVNANRDRAAVFEPAEEHLFGERIADIALNDPCERARAVERVVAFLGQPGPRLGRE